MLLAVREITLITVEVFFKKKFENMFTNYVFNGTYTLILLA